MRLKCDLHLHTSEDPRHQLHYSAKDMIEEASKKGYHVISITNHNTVTYDQELADFAHEKGILLVPGVEATIMGGKSRMPRTIFNNVTANSPLANNFYGSKSYTIAIYSVKVRQGKL